MDRTDFESNLYRLSVKAIHALSGNTQDVITVEESIEHYANFRPNLYCVQIWSIDFNKVDSYCGINFVLSSDFMMKDRLLTLTGKLHRLKWIFEIQRCDYDEDDIANWLVKSKIKVNYEEINITDIELKDFVKTIQETESDCNGRR